MVASSVRVTIFALVHTIERCVVRRSPVCTVAVAITSLLALSLALLMTLLVAGRLCRLHRL